MNNTVIFKDFDELQRAIAESRKAWENGTNAQMMKKADTCPLIGIQGIMKQALNLIVQRLFHFFNAYS